LPYTSLLNPLARLMQRGTSNSRAMCDLGKCVEHMSCIQLQLVDVMLTNQNDDRVLCVMTLSQRLLAIRVQPCLSCH
jgi:hypothetical protein